MKRHEIAIFETDGLKIRVRVSPEQDTVWLNRMQMAELFGRDVKTIGKHIANARREELAGQVVVAKFATTTPHGAIPGRKQTHMTEHYNLDVILSVGYRVKSKRGIEFRKWANGILKEYLLNGYVANRRRLRQLGTALRLMQRVKTDLDASQVLDVVQRYETALELLDSYDHQTLKRPAGTGGTHVLTYAECRTAIDRLRFGNESALFGVEKDDSFRGSIGNIYQTFGGEDVYPSVQEKAANLLYLVTKNHSFLDGNKRIAATMFLYFLDRNGILYGKDGEKLLPDETLVALTIMIAESKPEEKETMISVIVNCMGSPR